MGPQVNKHHTNAQTIMISDGSAGFTTYNVEATLQSLTQSYTTNIYTKHAGVNLYTYI